MKDLNCDTPLVAQLQAFVTTLPGMEFLRRSNRINVPYRVRQRRGLTLIEVVASLLLCGLLFGFVISSFTQHRRNFERAALMQRAIDEVDRLVASWYMDRGDDSGPRVGSGRFEGDEPMFWQAAAVVTEPELQRLGIVKYRLEVRSSDQLLVQLELLGSQARSIKLIK